MVAAHTAAVGAAGTRAALELHLNTMLSFLLCSGEV